MTLTDTVILIRPLQHTDRDAVYAATIESVAELSPWLPWCHSAYARDDTAAYIQTAMQGWASESEFTFGIFDAADGAHCGNISLSHLVHQHRYGSVGYWVRTSCTGRGLASRAVRLVARFAFGTVGLMRLEIAAMPENVASRRVAEKAGAKLEAVVRNRIVLHGWPYPAALYSLVPEDLD